MLQTQEFAFDFDPSYRRAARLFGITEANTQISINEHSVYVRFGPWRARSRLDNLSDVSLSYGPWSFAKTAGPAHLSFADRGLTFATNGRRGVCLQFHRPISGIEPFGLLHHPSLTLTPTDCEGLAQALRQPSI
jgi:hypothetical protein